MHRDMRGLLGVFLCLLGVWALPAAAQESYPSKPIRVIVPSAPGGHLDLSSRALMQELAPIIGQPVTVENRPGASLLAGTQFVAKSAPDGYTLLAMSNTFAVAPSLVASAGYDPIKDFDPIGLMNSSPLVVAVSPTSPFKSLQQMVAMVRDGSSQVSYGSAGSGSSSHLTPLMFFMQADATKALHVPYKGNALGLVDVMGWSRDIRDGCGSIVGGESEERQTEGARRVGGQAVAGAARCADIHGAGFSGLRSGCIRGHDGAGGHAARGTGPLSCRGSPSR